jgi:hypothetical protein
VCDLNFLLELIKAKILELTPNIIQSPKLESCPSPSSTLVSTTPTNVPMPVFQLTSPQLSPQLSRKETVNASKKNDKQ